MVGAIQMHMKQMFFVEIACILAEDIISCSRIKEEIE